MSQPSLTTPPQAPISLVPLPPALQSALSSLDVNLEEELTRYRRQRAGEPAPPPRGLARQPAPKTLDLISITATVTSQTAQAAPVEEPTPASPQPLQNPPVPLQTLPNLVIPVETAAPLSPPSAPAPNDYLESSEALLKSLAEEEEPPQLPRQSWWESLRTPLGIGSLLLLLMVSATFGFLLKNPSLLTAFQTQQQPQPSEPETPPPTPAKGASGANLSDREFVNLDLKTITTLKPQAQPVPVQPPAPPPKPVAKPVLPPPSASVPVPTPVLPAPATQPSVVPPPQPANTTLGTVQMQPSEPPQSPPETPSPEAAPPPEVAAAPQADAGLYYVVVNDSRDRTLEQVQSVVPDAYLRDFPAGTRIQLGAFSDQAGAEKWVQELKNQGIAAELYQP